MSSSWFKSGKVRAGFTLLEMMIAIALVGILIVALNTFVFSMGELWGRGSEKRVFEQHVRTVSRFLERELRLAGLPPHAVKGSSNFIPEEIRPSGGTSEVLLTFELPEGSRLISWPDRPLPEVVCSLQVREQKGLFLLWHSRLETRYEVDAPREALISPFVSSISYDYFDADTKVWTTERTPRKDTKTGAYTAPRRIQLNFAHKGFVQGVTIPLPQVGQGLPNF